MMTTAQTALLSKQALLGYSILGCCCKDEVDETGGRQFSDTQESQQNSDIADNPWLTFTPLTDTTESQSDPEPIVTKVSSRSISKYATLRRSNRTGRSIDRRRIMKPVMQGLTIDEDVRVEFQKYLLWEESEFLTMVLAAEDEDCCYECSD